MRGAFTSTFIVLALGVVIGACLVLGPLTLEDVAPIPTERGAAVVPVEPASLTAPASPTSIEEEVAERLALETAKAERLVLAERPPVPGDPEASSSASSDARAASKTALPASPPPQDAVPEMATAPVSNDASPNAKTMNEAVRAAAAVAGTDLASGTQLAALTPDEICRRDGKRLERLRSNPSSDEAQRFANELGCEKLRPQILGLMESLARPPAVADVPNAAPSGAQAAHEAIPPAPAAEPSPHRKTAEDESANLDVQLEGKPFNTKTRRPVEITEPPRRPDTREKLPLAERAAPPAAADVLNAAPSGAQAAREDVRPALPVGRANVGAPTSDETCKRDEDRLVRLRLNPSGEEAQRFASELRCEALRPQVQRLMESLGLVAPAVPEPSGSRPRLGPLPNLSVVWRVCKNRLAQSCARVTGDDHR